MQMIKKVFRVAAAFALIAPFAVGSPTPVFAGTDAVDPGGGGGSCGSAYVYAYEDVDRGGDVLVVCYGRNISDLRNIPHAPSGICSSWNFKFDDNWNDCISSAYFNEVTVNTAVCFYEHPNYGGASVRITSDGTYNWGWGPLADTWSSIRWC